METRIRNSDLETLPGPWQADDMEPQTWVEETGTAALALAYSTILWPDFVENRSGVFLERAYNEAYVDAWFDKLGGDVSAVEATVNHLHLSDIFETDSDLEPTIAGALGARMVDVWSAKLAMEFPGRRFVVQCSGPDETQSIEDCVITFYSQPQVPPAPSTEE